MPAVRRSASTSPRERALRPIRRWRDLAYFASHARQYGVDLSGAECGSVLAALPQREQYACPHGKFPRLSPRR